ncbi:MAG TPA: VWA domain-containing protein, partial [Phnomibacter sp.]|nr:VWA domain-containing protein [Phnomibacter sp.]
MKQQAFATQSITESIVAFAQFVRSHGLNVGIQETQDALLAAGTGLTADRHHMRYALKALFCNTPEERLVFEKLFVLFWDTNPVDLDEERRNLTKVQGRVDQKTNPSLVMMGFGDTKDGTEEAKNVSGANATERLKRTDLSKLSEIEAGWLEEIASRLFKEMALRLRRRMKQSPNKGMVHLRSTIRRNLSKGGEPIELMRRAQKPSKQRLIVLLD